MKDVVRCQGHIVIDIDKPDGTLLKLLVISRLSSHGKQALTGIRERLIEAYRDFVVRQA